MQACRLLCSSAGDVALTVGRQADFSKQSFESASVTSRRRTRPQRGSRRAEGQLWPYEVDPSGPDLTLLAAAAESGHQLPVTPFALVALIASTIAGGFAETVDAECPEARGIRSCAANSRAREENMSRAHGRDADAPEVNAKLAPGFTDDGACDRPRKTAPVGKTFSS